MQREYECISKALSFLAALLPVSAMAITPNVYVPGSPLVNPFVGQETEVWKLVGKLAYPNGGSCSAIQINREWVIATGHCSIEEGAIFTNGYSLDPRGSGFVCTVPYKKYTDHMNDMSACRLKNPERFTAPSSYPPIIEFDSGGTLVAERGVGSNIQVGYGGGAMSANFGVALSLSTSRLSAYKKFYTEANRLGSSQQMVWDGGDSGGGFYWFAPDGQRVGLYDVISGPLDATWLKSVISAAGSPLPEFTTFAEVGGGSFRHIPPPLAVSANIRVTAGAISVSWTAPELVAGEQIDDYHIYEGVTETPETQMYVGNATRSVVINGISQLPGRILCVVPRNDGQEPTEGHSCISYDARIPNAVGGIGMTQAGVSKIKEVTITWSKPDNMVAVINHTGAEVGGVSGYSVVLTVKSPAGTVRTTTMTTPSYQTQAKVNVAAGSQVCSKISALTSWATGAASSYCQTIR